MNAACVCVDIIIIMHQASKVPAAAGACAGSIFAVKKDIKFQSRLLSVGGGLGAAAAVVVVVGWAPTPLPPLAPLLPPPPPPPLLASFFALAPLLLGLPLLDDDTEKALRSSCTMSPESWPGLYLTLGARAPTTA